MSDGLDEINQILAAQRKVTEHFQALPEAAKGDVSEAFKEMLTLQRGVVEACYIAAKADFSDETEEIIGRVWAQRLRNACAAEDTAKIDKLLTLAKHEMDIQDPVHPNMGQFLTTIQPFLDLASEQVERASERHSEMMVEGFRRAAETTPGMKLRITEEVGDTLIKDEMVIGPEAGYEDTMGMGRLSKERMEILGINTNAAQAHHERITRNYAKGIIHRYPKLNARTDFEEVVYTVAQRAFRVADSEFDKAIALTEPPHDFVGMEPGHFSWLKGQLINGLTEPLTEGAYFSRSRQGDLQAKGVMQSVVVRLDSVLRSKPYFVSSSLPANDQGARTGNVLPADEPIIVFHDQPYKLADGVEVLAWIMHTTDQGKLEPVGTAYIVEVGPMGQRGFDMATVSLETEAGAKLKDYVESLAWILPEQMKINNKPGSRKWQRKIEEHRETILANGSLAEVNLPI